MTIPFDLNSLKDFCGSQSLFKHWYFFPNLVYTEGIRYLAVKAGCYWLIEEIGLSLPILTKNHPDHFYSIKFIVHADHSAEIVFEDGNNNVHFKQNIHWTDFPVEEATLTLYLCESDQGYCLMLSSEY